VDSLETGDDPVELYRSFARSTGAVVCVSGPVDWVTNGKRTLRVDNGHPLLTRVTGMGCSATAAVGAFAATEVPLLSATALAMGVFGACAEMAAVDARGPGTFVPLLLDALAEGDVGRIAGRVNISEP
jgi:hydroxyethylthiazole kinase